MKCPRVSYSGHCCCCYLPTNNMPDRKPPGLKDDVKVVGPSGRGALGVCIAAVIDHG